MIFICPYSGKPRGITRCARDTAVAGFDQIALAEKEAPGMDVQILKSSKPSSEGDSRITVLGIGPQLWELVFAGISQPGERLGKTAREWCESNKLNAAINVGMFARFKVLCSFFSFEIPFLLSYNTSN